ncbi:hypothetical protein B0J17DRAFT_717741 [Rhizoctonia solani]|nr:hypothetical protein B0J17DRAFT_717741 [Rhizoctonia solani]
MDKRHSTFYFDETLVVLKVENVIFKVLSQRSDDSVQGTTPEHRIVFNGVTAADFEAF